MGVGCDAAVRCSAVCCIVLSFFSFSSQDGNVQNAQDAARQAEDASRDAVCDLLYVVLHSPFAEP